MNESVNVRDVIGQAAENVLETMFFTMPYDGPYDGRPQPETDTPGNGALCASLRFLGEFSGDFMVETPIEAAREIAANFTGAADPQEISDEKAAEVIAELANMVCGSTLSILHRDQLFDLDAPQVRFSPQMGREENRLDTDTVDGSCAAMRSLDLGNGNRIVFRLRGHA